MKYSMVNKMKLENEMRLIISNIVNTLRDTQNHQLGTITKEFSVLDYPSINSNNEIIKKSLSDIKNTFRNEGYSVIIHMTDKIFCITLDWRVIGEV